MKITYDTPVPPTPNQPGTSKWIAVLDEFVASDHLTVCIEFDTIKDARNCGSSIYGAIKRNKYNLKSNIRGTAVYITKVGDD